MIAEQLRPLVRPITDFRLLDGNPRRGDVQAVKRSLKRFGQRKPIVAREDGTVIAGNHTLLAARELGWSEIAVVGTDDDEATAKAYALADNRTSALGSFDLGDLALMAAEVHAVDPALLDAASFTEADLNELLNGKPEQRNDPDDTPEPPDKPVTVPGDVWLLGPHRLLCGDATKRADVQQLMDGERAPLMVTDPPYGVAYHANKKGKKAASIAGDLTQAAIPLGFAVAIEAALDDDARVYLFGGTANWPMYSSLFDHHLRMQPRPMVWVKESFVLHPTHYHSQYETVFFGWKGRGGGADHWYGDRKQSDIWNVSRDQARVHPTQKPVEVCAIPIRYSAPPGGLVYEPFGGSGSTLIAAHLLGRRARVMELDPRFCDVICRRYQEHTGTKPVLEATGEPHDFT